MAEFDFPEQGYDITDTDTGADEHPGRRGPSILLLLSAIAALAVSAWALLGPFSLDFLAAVDLGWVFVAGAVVVGAVLVLMPGRHKNHKKCG